MAGLYGMMSMFTGHPLELMQWLFYIYSILVVPLYASAFKNIMKPDVLENAAVVVSSTIDTFITIFYTFYFAFQWLFNEDVTIEELPGQDYSKSATQGYEYGWILFSSFAVIACKVYFNLVTISFYKKLIKFRKVQGVPVVDDGAELDLKNQPKWKQLIFKVEYWCYRYLNGKI
jgi:hypothetical protein